MKTVEEVIAKFGEPDHDNPDGLRTQSPASDTEPSVVRSYRVLRYSGLSETAHVNFTDYVRLSTTYQPEISDCRVGVLTSGARSPWLADT